MARIGRDLASAPREIAWSLARNIAGYAAEARGPLPSAAEVTAHRRQVTRLDEATAAIATRIEKLEAPVTRA